MTVSHYASAEFWANLESAPPIESTLEPCVFLLARANPRFMSDETTVQSLSTKEVVRFTFNHMIQLEDAQQVELAQIWERTALFLIEREKDSRRPWTSSREIGPNGDIAYVGAFLNTLVITKEGELYTGILGWDGTLDGMEKINYKKPTPSK